MKEIIYHKKWEIKRVILGIILAALIGILLIVFGLFQVRDISVTGNTLYTSTDITNAIMQDGLCKNTLYLIWKFKDDSHVAEAIPFLNSMEVQMESPFKVNIRVYEKPEVGYVLNGTDYIYFDRDGLIVEISKKKRKNIPEITGVTLSEPKRYEMLTIKEKSLLNSIIQITRLLNKNEIVPKTIKFDEKQEIMLYLDGNRIQIGTTGYLDEKIAALQSIYGKLASMQGTLHMETFTEDTQTITYKQGEVETTLEFDNHDGQENQNESESESGTETESNKGPTYSESDGTFSTDAQGNKIYIDAAGNITPNVDEYQYTDENGEIITDGYGYIDPYTGAYILGQ